MKSITKISQIAEDILPVYRAAIIEAITNDECVICYESLDGRGTDSHGIGIACGCSKPKPSSNDPFYSTDRDFTDDEMDRYL